MSHRGSLEAEPNCVQVEFKRFSKILLPKIQLRQQLAEKRRQQAHSLPQLVRSVLLRTVKSF